MLRRFATRLPAATATAVVMSAAAATASSSSPFATATAAAHTSRRCYTPSPALQQLYASDFDKGEFPASIVPSDAVLFAKFLYKAAEQTAQLEAVLQDFRVIAAAVPQLPVFWERTSDVGSIAAFARLSEPTRFTLHWMQSNGMLDLLADVAEVYEAYVNAKLKRAVAKVYVAPGACEDKATIAAATAVAQKLLQDNPQLAGYTLSCKVLVDRAIDSGFAVDLQGVYVNEAKGKYDAGAGGKAGGVSEADYLAVPPQRLPRTTWDDNVETEAMRSYLDSLAEYDAEELKYGV